jgi:hypothetical protein
LKRPLGIHSALLRVSSAQQLPGIASFWRDVMGAVVEELPEADGDGSCGSGPAVQVHFAGSPSPQSLLFVAPLSTEGEAVSYDGYHLALYVRDFEATFQRLALTKFRLADPLVEILRNRHQAKVVPPAI